MTARPYTVYRKLTTLGRNTAKHDMPPISDTELWAYAAAVAPTLYPADEPDADELADLRAAYDEGRQPDRIDMFRLAAMIRDRGVSAYVEHTGGGCATILAGDTYTDMRGDVRHAVEAGPGVFPTHTTAYGTRDDFWIGPDNDGDLAHLPVTTDTHPTLGELADAIVALTLTETERHRKIAARLDAAVTAGLAGFWVGVAQVLPELADNGFDDDIEDQTRQQLLRQVRRSVWANAVDGRLNPDTPIPAPGPISHSKDQQPHPADAGEPRH
jgi:hypothetical protein